MSQKMDLKTALAEIEKLKEEKQKLREEVIELKAEKMKMEEEWENEAATYTEINQENKFLKKRVIDLEQSYETINAELKRMKTKFETNDLESFMELYGKIMERGNLKVIQHKFFEATGIKYTQAKLKRELEGMGYQVKNRGHKQGSYVSKNVGGFLYIVQLNKHKGTDIYKVGRTIHMSDRLLTYKQHDGGATEIICKPVNNQFKAEANLLHLLNEAVEKNELKKDEYGDEYFEGSLDIIKQYYNNVIDEYAY